MTAGTERTPGTLAGQGIGILMGGISPGFGSQEGWRALEDSLLFLVMLGLFLEGRNAGKSNQEKKIRKMGWERK